MLGTSGFRIISNQSTFYTRRVNFMMLERKKIHVERLICLYISYAIFIIRILFPFLIGQKKNLVDFQCIADFIFSSRSLTEYDKMRFGIL